MTDNVTTLPESLNLPKYLEFKQQAQEADIYIDGEITADEYEEDPNSVSAIGFRKMLQSLGDVKQINLHINSPGGNVFAGIAIYNMLKMSKAKVNVYVDAIAASIASVIAMGGDAIFMPENSMMMIHNPYTMVVGNANQLRKAAQDMDQITKASVISYLDKAKDKLDESTLRQLMDNETWLTAEQAYEYGLADKVIPANKAVASIDNPFAKSFKSIPKQLLDEEAEEDKQESTDNKQEEHVSEQEAPKQESQDKTKWLKELAASSKAEREARSMDLEELNDFDMTGGIY